MPEGAAGSLEEKVEQILERLDALDIDALGAMLSDDAQSIDEITRGWTRGRAAVEGYLSGLKDAISEASTRMSDAQETVWGDVGLVTFVMDQTYTMDGQQHAISAPTSILFRRDGGDWKVCLIHSVPLPEPQ